MAAAISAGVRCSDDLELLFSDGCSKVDLNLYKQRRQKEIKMGVNSMHKLAILILILVLLSSFAYAQVSSDTAVMQQINEQLARNKAEIMKSVSDAQLKSQNATAASIDANFAVLDTRIQDFFKAFKRDVAVIMVAGFLVAFALSQVIRLSIERARRRNLMKKGMQLEVAVEKLDKEMTELTAQVKQLKALDDRYSQDLKRLTEKESFITLRMVLFGIMTLLIGVIVTYFVAGGKV